MRKKGQILSVESTEKQLCMSWKLSASWSNLAYRLTGDCGEPLHMHMFYERYWYLFNLYHSDSPILPAQGNL